jgi:hypothetical protein
MGKQPTRQVDSNALAGSTMRGRQKNDRSRLPIAQREWVGNVYEGL